jgi:hypothetical protein
VLRENGKRLMTREAYAQTLLPSDFEYDDVLVNQYGLHTDPDREILIPIETSPGRFRFMPGPEFSPRLYRGQNQLFAPCRPSLYRCEAIEAMYWATKTLELGALLWQHPVCMDFASWNLEGLTFDLNVEAIAQHYGFPTVLLDFSRSKDVAMFFATCAFDSESRQYSPAESGTAVLYTANLRTLLLDPKRAATVPLGFEPLPRPEAQMAFAVPLEQDEDLNETIWIQREEIELTSELSRRYFDMFDEGRALFPENPADRQIEALRDNASISSAALKLALSMNILPPHPHGFAGVVREFRAAGFAVVEAETTFDGATVAAVAADWNNRRTAFWGRIRMRGMAGHLSG